MQTSESASVALYRLHFRAYNLVGGKRVRFALLSPSRSARSSPRSRAQLISRRLIGIPTDGEEEGGGGEGSAANWVSRGKNDDRGFSQSA